jgi:hypothetical protein
MNKNAAVIGVFMLKAICLALTLVLGVSLFAASAFAGSGCGEKCRCHSRPMDMDHSKGEQIPFSSDFCNGTPMIPCDLESSRASDVPEFILGSAGGNLSTAVGLTGIATDPSTARHDFRGYDFYQHSREKSRSAPIYLQNLSFLI